jgi:hypothetical protein
MFRHVALVRTDVSEERFTYIIRVARIDELGTSAVTDVPSSSILATLKMDVKRSSETLVLTRATWHNISEDGILILKLVYSSM